MCYSVCDACLLPPMRDSRRAPHGIAKVRQKHKIRASVRGFVVVSATLYPTMVRLRGFSGREGRALPSDFHPFWAMLFSGKTPLGRCLRQRTGWAFILHFSTIRNRFEDKEKRTFLQNETSFWFLSKTACGDTSSCMLPETLDRLVFHTAYISSLPSA